jgi:hypothetical protein
MEFRTPNGNSYNPDSQPQQGNHVNSSHTPESHPQKPAKRKRIKKPNVSTSWWKSVAIIVGIVVIALLAYGYMHTKSQLNATKQTQNNTQKTSQQLISEVGKLVTLPSGETPTIATVNDASKLKSQPFFADAQNGDKVLIYSHAGKAVIYRPSTNKIIEYSKVNLNGS